MKIVMTLKKYWVLLAVVGFLVGISVLLFFISPTKIVEFVGVRNSYIVVFLLAAIGGLSTFTSTSFFTAIATFSTGGSNPLLLGLFGGIGIFISDTIFFYLANYGKTSVPESWNTRIEKISNWTKKFPKWVTYVFIYLYIGFTPFPNDLLMIALVVAGYTYRRIAFIVLIGSITIATVVAYLARLGVALF
jgi:hypothetical protein